MTTQEQYNDKLKVKMIQIVCAIERFKNGKCDENEVINKVETWLHSHPHEYTQHLKLKRLKQELRYLSDIRTVLLQREELRKNTNILRHYGKPYLEHAQVFRVARDADPEKLLRLSHLVKSHIEKTQLSIEKLQHEVKCTKEELEEVAYHEVFGVLRLYMENNIPIHNKARFSIIK